MNQIDLYNWELTATDSSFKWENGEQVATAEFNEQQNQWEFEYHGDDNEFKTTLKKRGDPTLEEVRRETEDFILGNLDD